MRNKLNCQKMWFMLTEIFLGRGFGATDRKSIYPMNVEQKKQIRNKKERQH